MLIAKFDSDKICKHGFSFSIDDDKLVKESQNIIIYMELTEHHFEIAVYSRPSSGHCSCLQRFDGSNDLIWHLGQGKFVDYTLLHSYMQKWIHSGLKIFALWKSIVNCAEASGMSCTLQYRDLHRAICGFMNNISMDFKSAFSCPKHGNSPSWIVVDGKNMGPLLKRVSHLSELKSESSDPTVLDQSSVSTNRIFLGSKSERMLVCQLVSESIDMRDFIQSTEITSPNGRLVVDFALHSPVSAAVKSCLAEIRFIVSP